MGVCTRIFSDLEVDPKPIKLVLKFSDIASSESSAAIGTEDVHKRFKHKKKKKHKKDRRRRLDEDNGFATSWQNVFFIPGSQFI